MSVLGLKQHGEHGTLVRAGSLSRFHDPARGDHISGSAFNLALPGAP